MEYEQEEEYGDIELLVTAKHTYRVDSAALHRQIVKKAAELLFKQQEKQFKEQLDAEIAQQVGPVVLEALTTARVKTNRYGEPTGEMMTLSGYIAEQAVKWAETPVKPNGYEADYAREENKPRLAWMVHKELAAGYKDAVEKAVTQVRAELDAGLGEAVRSALIKHIGK